MSLRTSIPGLIVVCLTVAFFISACNTTSNNQTQSNSANSAATPATAASSPAGNPNATKAKLNVNSATREQLLSAIPGMGNKMVHEFEEYRPYQSIQQFRKEIGKYVSPEQVADYEKYIFVPIDENQSDAATLQQIPGLSESEAQQVVAGRPHASREAFITRLATMISADELAIAKTYLVQR